MTEPTAFLIALSVTRLFNRASALYDKAIPDTALVFS